VPKYHRRVAAYGSLDELSATLGVVASHLKQEENLLRLELQGIQESLLHAGSWIATESGTDSTSRLKPFGAGSTEALERSIDAMEATLAELRGFILPGGHPLSAYAHVARTVCRRAEREVLEFLDGEPSHPESNLENIQVFLNRLSDYLFVLGRHLNRTRGEDDILWKG